jgi:hypothetical protein
MKLKIIKFFNRLLHRDNASAIWELYELDTLALSEKQQEILEDMSGANIGDP